MQTSYPTVIPSDTTVTETEHMTREFLQSQFVSLKEVMARKDEYVQRLEQRSYEDSSERNRVTEAMQVWAIEEFRNGDITESQAEAIAEIMGFDLTQEVEAEVTVTYNITLQVPIGEDAEDIVNDIDFESVSYNSDNITWLSASVDRIDI
jgi:hypothetical protein